MNYKHTFLTILLSTAIFTHSSYEHEIGGKLGKWIFHTARLSQNMLPAVFGTHLYLSGESDNTAPIESLLAIAKIAIATAISRAENPFLSQEDTKNMAYAYRLNFDKQVASALKNIEIALTDESLSPEETRTSIRKEINILISIASKINSHLSDLSNSVKKAIIKE